ncbi:MAG: DEAD/DEAH box helicase [Thermoanaerobaculia bacterium]|jgi:ATP-dependent RNA helicase DeaD
MSDEQTPTTFEQLGLRPELLATLTSLGYEAPTPIQEKTIPVMLEGRDLIGQAQTGTGKTAAFALPILQKIDPEDRSTQALVLAPTRELAMQVAEAFHTYSKGLGQITVLPVYGGAPIQLQLRHLERGAQIVVGTPGRLIDHLERGTLKLGAVRTVVLDEADEMLRMGFIDDVEMILSKVAAPRQTALFSATMPQPIQRIAARHLTDPVKIEVEHKTMAAPAIEQRFINVNENQKLDLLVKILELEESEATLVFRRTKTGAAELAEKLEARGFSAQAMHGDMTQSLRESVIRRLKAGQIEVVVATDVAARGLDVEQIEHVVNFDIPHDEEVYVHRIGRTGRAGRSGVATLFVTPRERRMLRDIERFTGAAIAPMKMPTRADVHAKRVAVFKESVRKGIEEGDLDLYVALVNEIAEESSRDIAEVAAAAARLANASRSLEMKEDERIPAFVPRVAPARPQAAAFEAAEKPPFRRERPDKPKPWQKTMSEWPEGTDSERKSFGDGGRESFGTLPARPAASRPSAPRASAPREARPPRGGGQIEAKARLVIALGTEHGLTAKNVVGSIANEANIPGRDIGPIEIGETSTIVIVPEHVADLVIEKCADSRLRGKSFRIRREGQPLGRERETSFRPEAKGQRPEQAEAVPEASGSEASAADSFEWTPTAGERLKRLKSDDRVEAPAKRPYVRAAKPYSPADRVDSGAPSKKPFYSRFKEGGAPPARDDGEKRPFRAKRDEGAKPYGDKPSYRARPTEGGAAPFRGEKKPFRAKRDEGAKPYGDKPSYRARPAEGGAAPFRGEKKPFRSTKPAGAKAYGDKPYRARTAEGGAPPRKEAGAKKSYGAGKGSYSKPASGASGAKKPFYKSVMDKKFKKKPK